MGTASTERPPERGSVATGRGRAGDVIRSGAGGDRLAQLQDDDEFQELRRRFRSFAFPWTAAFLVWFLLLILCANYARGFMATKLLGGITVGWVFALLQFVSTFGIAILYSRYANRQLDPLAAKLRDKVEGGAA